MESQCTSILRKGATVNIGLIIWKVCRRWKDSNPQHSRLNALTLSAWPPPAEQLIKCTNCFRCYSYGYDYSLHCLQRLQKRLVEEVWMRLSRICTPQAFVQIFYLRWPDRFCLAGLCTRAPGPTGQLPLSTSMAHINQFTPSLDALNTAADRLDPESVGVGIPLAKQAPFRVSFQCMAGWVRKAC